ncbi:MAG: peptidase T [Bacilli bacterium]
MEEKLQRFINYVKIDTQSDDTTHKTPSTEKQKNLSLLLVEELKELGLSDAYMDEYGIVYAHKKGKGKYHIGLNSHVDTALECSDENVTPQIIKNYDGGTIKLNDKYFMNPLTFPILKKHIGHDLVVTNGETLLGADDKAGIAIIMNALKYFKEHPEIDHHNISVAFTVDEEIGEGSLHFDIKKMNADFAYTIDGSEINDVAYENFNAYGGELTIKGVSVHPGEGKDKLINPVNLFIEIMSKLPNDDSPYYANEDEGFYHYGDLSSHGDELTFDFIIRDFTIEGVNSRVNAFVKAVNEVKEKYKEAKITFDIKKQYENMKNYVDDLTPVTLAMDAIKKVGLEPTNNKIRGGTDGATFTKMGLFTPNLGTGSYNHHGRFEFLDINEFYKMIDILIEILKC